MIAPCADKINKLVLENYCYMFFVGQTDLLCTLVQTFYQFVYQIFIDSHTWFKKIWIIIQNAISISQNIFVLMNYGLTFILTILPITEVCKTFVKSQLQHIVDKKGNYKTPCGPKNQHFVGRPNPLFPHTKRR